MSVASADRVAQLLARRERIDHELDGAVAALAGREPIKDVRVPRWLAASARVLPSRARLILARDYAFREASVARRRQAEMEADLLRLRGSLGSLHVSAEEVGELGAEEGP